MVAAPTKAQPASIQKGGRTESTTPPSTVSPETTPDKPRDRSPTRLKRTHNKVRTGCLTCRYAVRIMLATLSPRDEGHPRCQRCAKAGRFCEGYTQPKPSSAFDPRPNAVPVSHEVTSNFHRATTIHFFEDSDFNRPTQYFLECTAPRIASYFAEMMDSIIDDKSMVNQINMQAWTFWNRLVIQASETNACIRHSLAAISSLHEWLEFTKRTPWQNQSFTLHYTKAIAEINQDHGKLPLEIILVACVLFAHCDFLMGASAAGLTHLKSGQKIILESKTKQAHLSPEVRQLIEPVIEGFILKSANYRLTETSSVEKGTNAGTTYSLPEMPKVFRDLDQSNKFLQQALYWVLLLELGQPNHLSSMAPGVRKYVADWATSFGQWKVTYELDDPVLKDWQLLLLAHHRMALLILKSLPPENDKIYSRAAADFRIMFVQIRTFLRGGYTELLHEEHNDDLVLKVHLGFIAPLFFLATECRARDLRHSALDALRDLKVVEGHWNSCVAYAIAKTATELDEKASQGNPGKTVRIKLDSVDRWKDGTMTLKYYKVGLGNVVTGEAELEAITEPACHDEVNMQWVSADYLC
ncbi:hypothetical protein PV08_09476 [Exophiala spinifera]|uniref:Zn(2)-C6 fungal-type domain-containing protein n=1 Tax=Exophiala spinifera TaxID=91928 RepID=A0A0D2B0F1_9EURO|nr:uncharacterized protein PV08_09476 [Exophiala spinifera]KIW12200.1 hypothetical protein PV08_09476 [Exophiala spinifera]